MTRTHDLVDEDWATTPLGDLVTAVAGSARVLESHGLDYCCGGGRALGEACDAAGIDTDQIIGELASLDPAPVQDWAAMTAAELVDHLEMTHHAGLWRQLPSLEALAAKVADVHGSRHPELAGVLDRVRELRADFEPHLAREEQVLFPMVRSLAAGETSPSVEDLENGPLAVLTSDHDQTAELLIELRTATGGYRVPEDGCASYASLYDQLDELEADTHLHVHKENNVLFPAILALAG